MPAGRRGRGAPYPTHITLDGVGFMLTQQKNGSLDWDEQTEATPGPEGEGTQKVALLREDFSGGFGVTRDDGTPEARRALFTSRVYDRAGRDPVGGGLDPRFGGLMRGPRVQMFGGLIALAGYQPSASDSRPIRKLVSFTPASGSYAGQTIHLAAVGPNLIATTNPLVWTAPTAWVAHAFGSVGAWHDIVDLKVYGARKGGAELEIALDGWPRHITYDLATYTPDGTTAIGTHSNRTVKPQAFYFWDASQNQFYDVTALVTDDNPETGTGAGVAPGYLGAMQTDDYLLVGFRHVFDAVQFTFGSHQNSGACVVTLRYWTGTATQAAPHVGWSYPADTATVGDPEKAFSGLVDGTSKAGSSFGQSGDLEWAYGAPDDWVPATLTNQYESEPLYFVKLHFSAIFDSNVALAEVRVRYRLQPEAFAVAGTNLVFVQDNSLIVSPGGGTEGILYDQTGPFAIPTTRGGAFSGTTGAVIGAVNLAGTILVIKTDGIYSVSEVGETREIAPHMGEQPSVEWVDRDVDPAETGNDVPVEANQGYTVWGGALYVAHDWEILKINADGTGDIVGPERMTFGASTVELRATALEGHGLHFLYGAFKGSDGNSYLGAFGTYRHLTDPNTGVEVWKRMEVWSLIGDLGGRTITSMRVMYDTNHQPFLVMGDEYAEILVASLARGFHPLDAGSGYQCSDALAEAVFPQYDGHDPTRSVTAYRSTWRIRYANGSYYAELWTKGGHPDVELVSDPWTRRCVVTDPDQEGFDDQPFNPVHTAHGLNVKLRLWSPPAQYNPAPIVDAFAPWYRQIIRANQRRWTFNVQAHDRVLTLQQRRIPRTTAGWEAYVRALADRRVALVTPTGETRQVMVEGIAEKVSRPAPQGPPQLAYSIRVSSAE